MRCGIGARRARGPVHLVNQEKLLREGKSRRGEKSRFVDIFHNAVRGCIDSATLTSDISCLLDRLKKLRPFHIYDLDRKFQSWNALHLIFHPDIT